MSVYNYFILDTIYKIWLERQRYDVETLKFTFSIGIKFKIYFFKQTKHFIYNEKSVSNGFYWINI